MARYARDILEDLGAVRRLRDPVDRRRHQVELTDLGRGLAGKAARIAKKLDEELLAPLDADQRAALRETLRGLAAGHGLFAADRLRAADSP